MCAESSLAGVMTSKCEPGTSVQGPLEFSDSSKWMSTVPSTPTVPVIITASIWW
jgi:hypothetical protein